MPRAHKESSIPVSRQGGVSVRAGAADNQKGQRHGGSLWVEPGLSPNE